jgi:hypothetical protein
MDSEAIAIMSSHGDDEYAEAGIGDGEDADGEGVLGVDDEQARPAALDSLWVAAIF